ncbi:MAG: hypothetical protein ACO1OK_02035 [Devosia sp.]
MRHPIVIALTLICATGPVLAQDVTVNIDRGVLETRPFTAIYPQSFQQVDDGNAVTVLTLQHNEAPIQCDVLIADGQTEGWTAESALSSFDRGAVETTWREQFPDFAVTESGTRDFQSGPALYYEGEAQQSPLGFPVRIAHAEAADQGRTYIFECLMDLAIAEESETAIAFMIANFSTRADAECCAALRQ